jgi:hypothetical protein
MLNAKRILWLLVALSLIPAAILTARRIQAEGDSLAATLLIDEAALFEQAEYMGLEPMALALRYREAGLNGVALYEDVFETAAERGRIAMMSGNQARFLALQLGEELPDIPGKSTLVTEIEPGALRFALEKNGPAAQEVTIGGTTWYLYPGEGKERPMGPDEAKIRRFAEAGFDLAYRPKNFPNLQRVGHDFPPEANYLIHQGTELAGSPNLLSELVEASQNYFTGLIEMTEQDGMADITGKVPMMRVFSLNQDWLNTLDPREAGDKYILAANERNARLLYIRPYTKGTQGDLIENTETLIRHVRLGLERSGFTIGEVTPREIAFETSTALRAASAAGILAGLGLLALLYPGAWGVTIAAGVLGLGIVANRGMNWDALALAAALAFPIIGYGHLKERFQTYFFATLVSLAGAILLVAVGSDRDALLGAAPFRGVAATLVVPPVLFLFHYMLRYREPVKWVMEFWNYPIRVSHVVLGVVGLAALAVVFLRRGNFPVIGVSDTEVGIRQLLSEFFARPRFKELIGHPLAVLALTNGAWPAWIKGLLLAGGVIAQASILNSFSHYHTPVLVSLERTLVALGLGLVIGLLLVPIARLATGGLRRWLARAEEPKPARA